MELNKELWANLLTEYSVGKTYSRNELAETYNISDRLAGNLLFALENKGLLFNNIDDALLHSKKDAKYNDELKKNKGLIDRINELIAQNEFLLGIEGNTYEPIKISPQLSSEATAISILSDIHVEERVEAETVNFKNDYNPDIAKQRINNYFYNLLTLVNKERKDINVNNLVVGFLGDMITGYIHEELRESNYMSPTEAVMFVKEILIGGLKHLSDNGNFDNIIIPCCKGNHGRNTDKKRFSTAYKNSYEWMMYHDIQKTCKLIGLDNVKFIIPKSELTYLEVYDKILRFGHGDHFRYGGGVGGVAVPLMKFLFRSDSQQRADMTFLGHWHQNIKPNSNVLLNGSVIGYNAFAQAIGAKPEPPLQQFILLDRKRGFTVNTPVIVE